MYLSPRPVKNKAGRCWFSCSVTHLYCLVVAHHSCFGSWMVSSLLSSVENEKFGLRKHSRLSPPCFYSQDVSIDSVKKQLNADTFILRYWFTETDISNDSASCKTPQEILYIKCIANYI